MYVSYNWLCEIIPGLNKIPASDLAKRLTMSGLEVEEFIDQGAKLKGIIVGEVVHREKHPNADKLSLTRVSTGKEEFQVVCGAPNVQAGRKYPFATLGTVMPGGLEIKPIKLRGVESFGMLCSAKELELSAETSGLYELDLNLPTGQDIASALSLDDVILGLNITPNRGDALSHWGVARDIAALTGLKPNLEILAPASSGVVSGVAAKHKSKQAAKLKVSHQDHKACPRYSASQIFGVKIAPSPVWLSRRLEALGLRSINNVVDATNYVMLLTGHPVHAFDAANVADQHIQIYSLQDSQKFKTLDGVERQLLAGDLVIADGKHPVALAGIMGGENSEVKDQTQDLILEVAFFDPNVIRRTSRRLGLQTESSYRFARFVNPDSIVQAHEILRDLIVALAGGEVSDIIDSYPKAFTPVKIEFPESEIARVLGITVPRADVNRILTGLNCQVQESKDGFIVTVPIARSDLQRPADLVEEIARIYGMDKIPPSMPRLSVRSSAESKASRFEHEIKDFFVARGFHETVHYSFGDAKLFETTLKIKADELLPLKNPLSEDLAMMRPSHLPQLLNTYKKNHLNTDKGLRLFELRKVYHNQGARTEEKQVLTLLYTGNPWGRNPYGLNRESDFYDGKGLLTAFFKQARIATEEKVHTAWPYHSGQSAEFVAGGKRLAIVGALHPELLQALKIKEKLFAIEIDYDAVIALYQEKPVQYQAISILPPVYRDLALLAPKELMHADVLAAIAADRPPLLKHIELFDLYEGPNLPAGKKSLAYSFVYQPEGESLTDEVVNQMHFALVDKLKAKLGVDLR